MKGSSHPSMHKWESNIVIKSETKFRSANEEGLEDKGLPYQWTMMMNRYVV